MGQQYASGSVTANISGNVNSVPLPPGIPAATSWVNWNVITIGNGANQTVVTVPAGHAYYLYGASCNEISASLVLYDASTVNMGQLINSATVCYQLVSPVPIIKYVAGTAITANCTNAKRYTLWGIDVTL